MIFAPRVTTSYDAPTHRTVWRFFIDVPEDIDSDLLHHGVYPDAELSVSDLTLAWHGDGDGGSLVWWLLRDFAEACGGAAREVDADAGDAGDAEKKAGAVT